MKHRTFSLGCIAIFFFALGVFDIARYFFAERPAGFELGNDLLRSGLIDVVFGGLMGWDAFTNRKKNAKPIPSYYPRTEASIYGFVALLLLAGAGFYAKLLIDADSYLDGWTRARDIAVVFIGLVAGGRTLLVSWKALREAKKPKSKAGEEPFTLP